MKPANVGLAPRTDDHRAVLPLVARALDGARRVLCVIHAGPDGDAVGSTLALALAMQERGKEVTLFCPTSLPENLLFLKGLEALVHEVPPQARFDATTICDVGHSSRIGPGLPARERLGVLLNIDHHLTTDDFGDHNYVDAEAAAVGVLSRRILDALGHPLSPEVAAALYTSVMTDTGSFRYASTDADALRVAADCVEAGAEPWEVASNIYERQPLARIRLLQEALGTLSLSEEGRLATMLISQEALLRVGPRPGLSDGLINFARGIQGVEVAAQLVEQEGGGVWRLSLRSRGRVDVAVVAGRLGGGGHRNAAGATVQGSADEAVAQVGAAVHEALVSLADAAEAV